MNYALVFLGGGLGSLARYATGLVAKLFLPDNFPYATFLSNAISSFILGILISYMLHKMGNEQLRLFVSVGFCGGLSTFSTFTYETFELLKSANYALATANIFLNFTVCILLFVMGYKIF